MAPRVPELLAPAGDLQCARAAIENGADAVYFGLDCGFNARARAANFSFAELPQLISLLHQRGVRGYATLNTLVFTGELPEAERVGRSLSESGVDAVLVQDLGMARLVREICPDLPVHASTQMSLTSAETIHEAQSLGIERVVLARELSIDEIRRIASATAMSLEVFVHGALCVAYSGQCLTSESLGGRSANRGQCAQACRLPYTVYRDGQPVGEDVAPYVLSPQDLAAYDLIPQLIDAGVDCLKIEGRLKSPEYVANVTAHYREAIRQAVEHRAVQLPVVSVREMEMSFSRGFSHGWLAGCDHKALVPADNSAKRGVRIGSVVSGESRGVLVRLEDSIRLGDGVAFGANRPGEDQQGGRVTQVRCRGKSLDEASGPGTVELRFHGRHVRTDRLQPGMPVWKTDDPQLSRRLRKSFSGADPVRRVPLDVKVVAGVDQPLRIEARAENGGCCQLESPQSLEAARKHPLDHSTLTTQLGRLGGSVYQLRHLDAEIVGEPMVPLSVLGSLRREMLDQLEASAVQLPKRRIATGGAVERMRERWIDRPTVTAGQANGSVLPSQLHVLCRNLEQIRAAATAGAASVYVDFHDIRLYRSAVEEARCNGVPIYLATPRIQKPGEAGIFRVLNRHGADGFLVRNLAGIRFCRENQIAAIGDFSLNVANELTAADLMQRGLQRVTASYDLNREQLLEMVNQTPPQWLETVIHQHMPMFHMEHCVFCAVISPGTNKTNCGRPCDRHEVHLEDRVGKRHPLHADVGCRNTLLNATPQSSAEIVPQLQDRGVRHFRVELLDQDPPQTAAIVAMYRELLRHELDPDTVWRSLRATNRVGVTRGTMEPRRDPMEII